MGKLGHNSKSFTSGPFGGWRWRWPEEARGRPEEEGTETSQKPEETAQAEWKAQGTEPPQVQSVLLYYNTRVLNPIHSVYTKTRRAGRRERALVSGGGRSSKIQCREIRRRIFANVLDNFELTASDPQPSLGFVS